MNEKELKKILAAHKLWLETKGEKGSRANLIGADLIGATLSGANLRRASLSEAHLNGADLSGADLRRADLRRADFMGANLRGANLRATNLRDANLRDANLRVAKYEQAQLVSAINVPREYLLKRNPKNIENEAEIKLQKLKEQLIEKDKLLRDTEISEKERAKITQDREGLNKEQERFENLKKEEANKKIKTAENIKEAISALKKPNEYLNLQIIIQYVLSIIYLILIILCIDFFISYLEGKYSCFASALSPETSTIQWLFYVSPILISFSLVITFINQINIRLKNIFLFNERKRYVDSIDGSLNAVLKINNDDVARGKILDAIDKILEYTIKNSEKMNEPLNFEEKNIEPSLDDYMKDIKAKLLK